MKFRAIFLFFLVVSLSFLNAHNSHALVLSTAEGGFRFGFSNPGARANAMGGAFIGVADDATAAYTNPAGLTILTQPEYSLEFKYTENDDSFGYWDNGALLRDSYENYYGGVSFLSFIYPRGDSTLALYRHQLINYENKHHTVRSDGYTIQIFKELKGTVFGLSNGIKISDNFSAGFSVGFLTFDFSALDIADDRDTEETYTASLLWNPVSELNIGLVYHYGPTVEMTKNKSGRQILNTLNIPDVYGIGLSYRFFTNLLISFDVNHIKYSELKDNYRDTAGDLLNPSHYIIEDTEEIHAGFEYVFSLKELPLAVRGGYSKLPDHKTKYVGPDPNFQFYFPGGEDETTYSFGVGTVVDNIQIDLAGVIGDFSKEGTISFVYRFE